MAHRNKRKETTRETCSLTEISKHLTLPAGAVQEECVYFSKIDRPANVNPQGFGYFVEFLVKWLMGFRKFPGIDADRIANINRRGLEMQDAIDIGLHAADRAAFTRALENVSLSVLLSQVGRYLPSVPPDENLIARAEKLGHREKFYAKADILGITLVVDIKVCVRDEPTKWFQQTLGYGALFNVFYGGRIYKLEVVNYLTGTVFRLNLKDATVGWERKTISEIDASIRTYINREPGPLLGVDNRPVVQSTVAQTSPDFEMPHAPYQTEEIGILGRIWRCFTSCCKP